MFLGVPYGTVVSESNADTVYDANESVIEIHECEDAESEMLRIFGRVKEFRERYPSRFLNFPYFHS